MDIDLALKIFNQYIEKFDSLKSSDLSETDTRSKVLDKIFIDVLGWSEENISRENYLHNTGFYDYVLSTGQFHFVAEAKKMNLQFKLPNKKRVKLKTLMTDPNNEEVINQIRNYLTEKGLAIGVISNGEQFIVSQFVNFNGEDWRGNNSIIFDGFQDISDRFIDFYELLSYEAVLLRGRIDIKEQRKFSKKIIGLARLKRKDEKLIRNELSHQLIRIIDIIFREIKKTIELDDFNTLKECYVFNEDVQKHHSEMSLMFLDRPPKFDENILPIANTVNTQNAIEDKLISGKNNLPNPIVLIGGKGVGKTTFINYFFKVSISDDTKKHIPHVYIDFRSFDSSDIKDSALVYTTILEKLSLEHPSLKLDDRKILLRIYKREIKKRSERGIWSRFKDNPERLNDKIDEFLEEKMSDSKSHLKAVSEYLISPSHKRLCVVFDNVDQLDFSIQKEAFLLAQSMHLNLKCLIIISLREGYYYQWKDKPPFDAYQPNIFHITAPSYRDVLKKRITYVIEEHEFEDTSGKLKNKMFKLSDAAQENFFRNLYKTLFTKRNSEILEFLEQTSYPNIRLGLEKFNSFLVSGHSQVETYMAKSGYNIPIWEFVKSVALESNYYYQSSKSKIYNLFYPSLNGVNHFLKFRILYYLLNEAEQTSYREHYMSNRKLLDDFVRCGYNYEVLNEEIAILMSYGFINTETYISDVQDLPENVEEMQLTITQSGVYYITKLISQFHYFDLIAQDTPIYNEDFFDRISQYFKTPDANGKRSLYDRVKFVEQFLSYLEYEESKENFFTIDISNRALNMNVVTYIKENGLQKRINFLNNKVIGDFETKYHKSP